MGEMNRGHHFEPADAEILLRSIGFFLAEFFRHPTNPILRQYNSSGQTNQADFAI
jgi:hypothetical protein